MPRLRTGGQRPLRAARASAVLSGMIRSLALCASLSLSDSRSACCSLWAHSAGSSSGRDASQTLASAVGARIEPGVHPLGVPAGNARGRRQRAAPAGDAQPPHRRPGGGGKDWAPSLASARAGLRRHRLDLHRRRDRNNPSLDAAAHRRAVAPRRCGLPTARRRSERPADHQQSRSRRSSSPGRS